MLGVALILARVDATARLAELDRRIGVEQARRVEIEAPLVRLIAAIEQVRRAPRIEDRERRLARLGAGLVAVAPAVERRAAAARRELDRLASERAELVVHALARGRASPPGLTAPLAPCASAPFRSPAEGRVVAPRVAASISRGRGTMLVTLPGAAIVAPAGGRIAYAGPFRRYGDVVILDHAHGWTTLLTGLERLEARAGTRVTAGAVLGDAGIAAPLVTIELSRHGRPVDALAMMRRCARGT